MIHHYNNLFLSNYILYNSLLYHYYLSTTIQYMIHYYTIFLFLNNYKNKTFTIKSLLFFNNHKTVITLFIIY